jgi:hypothetical protein
MVSIVQQHGERRRGGDMVSIVQQHGERRRGIW